MASSGARPDTNPGNPVPTGPSRTQPMTNNQKDFVNQLGASSQLPNEPTKGDASDVISRNLNGNNNSSSNNSNGGSGAAPDTNPNFVTPEGPSAKQPATRNQKAAIESQGGTVPENATKGQASEVISGLQGGSNGAAGGSGGTGAAPDNNPDSVIPTGPSAKQDATRNQKNLIDSLGATPELPDGATKGQASDIISKHQN